MVQNRTLFKLLVLVLAIGSYAQQKALFPFKNPALPIVMCNAPSAETH